MHTLLFNQYQIDLIVNRLSRQVLEAKQVEEIILIGVQPRGVFLANRIHQIIENLTNTKIKYGTIDDTFHRDDFRRGKLVKANETNIPFEIENKNIILIDDVLYTGRTIRAALDALLMYGRPKKIELLVLIDRRFNRELPIQPDYVGEAIDTIENTKVIVEWKSEENKEDKVLFVNEN
jgi:pyrimidine operon attenuation protein/uracil phosphoribosyltransferase